VYVVIYSSMNVYLPDMRESVETFYLLNDVYCIFIGFLLFDAIIEI